ncbi:MAG: cytochrome D1 domain-containing protein [Syntrophomonadaceae bacterium]
MGHAALVALLALQTASGSPNVAAPTTGGATFANAPSGSAATPSEPSAPSAAGEETSAAPAPAAPPPTPTPAPRRAVPTPAPRGGGGDGLVVVNKSDSSVSILDPWTGKTRATLQLDPGPHEAEMLADGPVVAVASYGTRTEPGRYVSLIEVGTGKVISRIDIGEGSRPHGLAALRNGHLLVTAEGKRELVVLDPRAGKILSRIPTGKDLSHMVAATPDGRRAFVTSLASGSVSVIDLGSGKVVKDIPTGKGAEGLDVTPDGREVWVANREANTIVVIDVATLAPVFTIQAPGFPIRVKITPDGRRALVTFTGAGEVRVYDTATRVEAAHIPLGRDAVEGTESRVFRKRFGSSPAPVGLLIAPDGKRAFVAASHADVVTVIDLERMRVDDAWTAGREPDGLAGRFAPKQPTPAPTALRPTAGPRPSSMNPLRRRTPS